MKCLEDKEIYFVSENKLDEKEKERLKRLAESHLMQQTSANNRQQEMMLRQQQQENFQLQEEKRR